MKAALLLGTTFLVISSMQAQAGAAARPNFTGTWVLDVSKSQSSGTVPTSATWVIIQRGDSLVADRESVVEPIGATKSRVVLGMDGKPWKNLVPQGQYGDVETSTVLTWEGSVLVLRATGNIQGTDFVQTDHWTLSADGKTLTSIRAVTVEGQEVQSGTFLFAKKP